MQILIIEDEPLVAQKLQKMILEQLPHAHILATLTSVKRALHWMEKEAPPDLIFTDIRLSDGISFDVFRRYPPACPVIFTTAYDEYALRAFEVHSIDYLLKPVAPEDLQRALSRLRLASPTFPDLQTLFQQWGSGQKIYRERFLAHLKNAWLPVTAAEVAFFQKDELIFLHTADGQRLVTDYHSMDELEAALNPTHFFRANRQFLLHLQSIGAVKNTHKGITVQLKKPHTTEVDISREKVQAFKKWVLGEN